ncbi:hypothetical protein Hdeb2414_s0018g00521961 [Helianthus debilis subsp. tardiflorus]
MDSDRPPPPHRPTTTSDLFICFTSRHHSSSMKLPSKSSILSPGRTGLTTSLSRRLRTNRSIKGAASPAMFPATGKKKGSGFENPEPSSPKVTCIGQVRIKSKKKHRLRSLSRRHSTGDVSFRKLERKSLNISRSFGSSNERNNSNNNHSQRWVHLPLTICEALRAFGSEFSCLFPCRSSCFSPVRERERKMTSEREGGSGPSGPSGSCAAVFTRWLVAFHDGDDSGRGGRRDGELVVEDRDEDEDEEDRMFRAARRHVFDDLEIVNNRIQGSVDEPRVSICIPPKNALLLMRCRSDPLKMEALANRLWESTAGQSDDQSDQDEDFVIEEYEDEIQQEACYLKQSKANDQEHKANVADQEMLVEECIGEREQIPETNDDKDDELTFFGSLFDEMVDQDQENDGSEENVEQVKGFAERSETTVAESKERQSVLEREELPECLLLMMYEPKLSMEVSKETWVSSKDFIRRQPSRKKPPAPPPAPVKPNASQSTVSLTTAAATTTTTATLPSASKCDKHVPASASISAPAAASVQPGRSSCSLPAPSSSMAEMLEQKLVNAVGYEPFVLTRCKSEPMKTAAAKLAPDNCFWKNRKLEPLRRASFGVGAAGIGC